MNAISPVSAAGDVPAEQAAQENEQRQQPERPVDVQVDAEELAEFQGLEHRAISLPERERNAHRSLCHYSMAGKGYWIHENAAFQFDHNNMREADEEVNENTGHVHKRGDAARQMPPLGPCQDAGARAE